ncbi:porphobilinogen synthase [Natronospora cellulosivora (SeqCode)]
MLNRPRRLRTNKGIRSLVRENQLGIDDLIYPLFVVNGSGVKEEIESLPGCYHLSIDLLLKEIEEIYNLGIKGILLFGIPAEKDEVGSLAYSDQGIVQKAIRKIKEEYPDLLVISDICLCGYTDHGHCGIIKDENIDNDHTLDVLSQIALSHARAGVDIVAPSDMMDGRVAAIRRSLDAEGFKNTAIMSYSVKYASAFYGPFREAAHSAPQFGDRTSYQMDFANSREAIREIKLDEEEGADILMVKPALSYLDIIQQLKAKSNLPVAAYSVSGEYAMIKMAAKEGLCDEKAMMIEVLTSIKRAGADIIITYYAKDLARELNL